MNKSTYKNSRLFLLTKTSISEQLALYISMKQLVNAYEKELQRTLIKFKFYFNMELRNSFNETFMSFCKSHSRAFWKRLLSMNIVSILILRIFEDIYPATRVESKLCRIRISVFQVRTTSYRNSGIISVTVITVGSIVVVSIILASGIVDVPGITRSDIPMELR